MRTIQKILPNPRLAEVHRIFVKARPEIAWQYARHFDGSNIPWVNFLFNLRDLPNRFTGRKNIDKDFKLSVDQVTEDGKGFMILYEEEGHEIMVGSVGQFWHADIPFVHLSPAEFTGFTTPGWGKLVWGITVEPYEEGSTIALELRVTATDEESWSRLKKYFSLIGIGSRLIRKSVMKLLESELGVLKRSYDDRVLAGDEIIPGTRYSITHHVDIEARASIVWRYIMQMGCDRAGWYSIDLLDNAAVPSADFLVEEWGERNVGDLLAATPERDGFFEVLGLEYQKSFVIGAELKRLHDPFKSTWAFILEPVGGDATTLVVRARMQSATPWKEWLLGSLILPPIHMIMEAAQLHNLKRIAERDSRSRKMDKVATINC